MPVLDSVASIGIAFILAITSAFLAYEVKSLLIGEPALPSVRNGIRTLAIKQQAIAEVCDIFTVHLGPSQVLALLTVRFDPKLTASAVAEAVAGFEKAAKAAYPELITVYVSPA
jgi:divalent metal cation (Fe/Co/Zn/Cd) transporter